MRRATMQSIKSSILRHLRIDPHGKMIIEKAYSRNQHARQMCSRLDSPEHIKAQVLGLVKKFDRVDAAKVTETADFGKDLSLDSLDRSELIMAFEEVFRMEIPDDNADKFTCCADVAKYIISQKSAGEF